MQTPTVRMYNTPLLSYRKSMNKGVLLYIHINFIVSLSLALAVFVVGIETATQYAVSVNFHVYLA